MISAPSTPEAQGEELEGGETDTDFEFSPSLSLGDGLWNLFLLENKILSILFLLTESEFYLFGSLYFVFILPRWEQLRC